MFPVHFISYSKQVVCIWIRFPVFSLLFLLPHPPALLGTLLLSPLLKTAELKRMVSFFITEVSILPIILHASILVCLFILEETGHRVFLVSKFPTSQNLLKNLSLSLSGGKTTARSCIRFQFCSFAQLCRLFVTPCTAAR